MFGAKKEGVTGSELSAHIYKIPDNYYEINAGNIDFSKYPDGIENDYLTIRITNLQSLFSLPVNFIDFKDITPTNLTTTFEALGKALLDIQKRLSDVAIYVDSGTPGQINLPKLPIGCVWYRDQNGNISSLPITTLYDEFDNLINYLRQEIRKLLDEDYKELSQDLRDKTDELLAELSRLDTQIEESITQLGNGYINNINTAGTTQVGAVNTAGATQVKNVTNEGTKQVGLVTQEGEKQLEILISTGGGLQERVKTLETDNTKNKQNISNLQNNKVDKNTYEEKITEISEEIENINFKLSPNFTNFKGEYDSGMSYKNGDVVLVNNLEEGYCFEIINPELQDSSYPKLFRKSYKVNSSMYFEMIDNKWEIIFERETPLELYTIPQKGTTQNYQSTFDNFYPYSKMKRVVLKNGIEQYELDFNDSTKKATGGTSVLTGADGDVMVRIPKFYCDIKKVGQGIRYRIFTYENPTKTLPLGLEPHPLFKDSGRDKYYTGAYKGYVESNVLRSISGKSPTVNKTKANFLDYARQGRDNKYNITSINELSAITILYLIEFADWNSQKLLGQGRSNTSSLSSTGSTNALGSRSGRISNDDSNGNVSYRGIEDIFGNIWSFVVGILLVDNGYYYTGEPEHFDNKTNMSFINGNPITTDGYITRMEYLDGIEHLFIPSEVGGSSSTYYCDNFWAHNTGEENIALAGGSWARGANCGVACLSCDAVASTVTSTLGARLSYSA